MSNNLCFWTKRLEVSEDIDQSQLLCFGSGISHLTTFIAYTNGTLIETCNVSTRSLEISPKVESSVSGDVIMVANIIPLVVLDMVLPTCLERVRVARIRVSTMDYYVFNLSFHVSLHV